MVHPRAFLILSAHAIRRVRDQPLFYARGQHAHLMSQRIFIIALLKPIMADLLLQVDGDAPMNGAP